MKKKYVLLSALVLGGLWWCWPRPIVGLSPTKQPSAAITRPVIKLLYPPVAVAGVPFQVVKPGFSSIGIAGEGFAKTSVVYFDERRLATNYQNATAIAAIVPNELIQRPGRVQVTVRDTQAASRISGPAIFEILPPPATASAPIIKTLYPSAAKGPDGSWSIGVAGANFTPKTHVLFDGVPVKAYYQSPTALTITVPARLLTKPRKVLLTVTDPAIRTAKPSSLEFDVRP